mmetsp:Transcript_8139/g.22086  ORF Transcript_8139/g.22086 Transcript_8139/m.22086 type:complete len:214 (-) Transcript_8139:349-990(-)
MGLIPHPEIPVDELRTTDMMILLFVGAAWELIRRLVVWSVQIRSSTLKNQERKLYALQYETTLKRKLGPSAFVETSKLERQVLAAEKELETIYADRKRKIALVQRIVRNANYAVTGLVFFVYYGIAIMRLDGSRLPSSSKVVVSEDEAYGLVSTWNKAFMFPISIIGVGMKLSKWGLVNPQASTGALVVFWSSQVTVKKIMEGVEALLQLSCS